MKLIPLTINGLILFSLISCNNNQEKKAAPPPVSVSVYPVATGTATFSDNFPATVTALNQVDIKPQVAGNITRIHFTDGQHVNKGQLLYEIDQQQYRGAYEQALANLEVSKASLAKAQQDAVRYQQLDKEEAIAKQILDHQLADLKVAQKQVEASKANVYSVQSNLKYANIYAPFSGTIGISLVKPGASVYQQTLLNTVSTDDPMAVDLAIDQSLIPRFTNYLGMGTQVEKDSIFTISFGDGTAYPFPGNLILLDRAVDPTTGTIKARLVFPNPKKMLKVGQTCNVVVKHSGGDNNILIPYKAITQQLGEYFVFVIIGKQAIQKKVELGNRMNDKIVIRSGIAAGDTIVTDGVQKLKDSSFVQYGK